MGVGSLLQEEVGKFSFCHAAFITLACELLLTF